MTSPTIHPADAIAIPVRRFGDEYCGAVAKLEVYEPFGDIAVLASGDSPEFDELLDDRSRLIVDLPQVNELFVLRQERVVRALAENSFRALVCRMRSKQAYASSRTRRNG